MHLMAATWSSHFMTATWSSHRHISKINHGSETSSIGVTSTSRIRIINWSHRTSTSSSEFTHTRSQQSWIACIAQQLESHHSQGLHSGSCSNVNIKDLQHQSNILDQRCNININDLHHQILHFWIAHINVATSTSTHYPQQQLNAGSSNSTAAAAQRRQQQLSPAARTTATATPNPKSSKHRRTSTFLQALIIRLVISYRGSHRIWDRSSDLAYILF